MTHHAYVNYGGRGITVAEEFSTIEGFLHWALDGYKDGLELDRRDNNKGYSTDNCRWVTKRVNARNRRNSLKEPCIYEQNGKGKFLVRVYQNKKLNNLGTFTSINDAVRVRDEFLSASECGGCSH